MWRPDVGACASPSVHVGVALGSASHGRLRPGVVLLGRVNGPLIAQVEARTDHAVMVIGSGAERSPRPSASPTMTCRCQSPGGTA